MENKSLPKVEIIGINESQVTLRAKEIVERSGCCRVILKDYSRLELIHLQADFGITKLPAVRSGNLDLQGINQIREYFDVKSSSKKKFVPEIIPIPTTIIFRGKPLLITRHAFDQFQKRWFRYISIGRRSVPKNWIRTMENLLTGSFRESLDSKVLAKRFNNHGPNPTEYWLNEGWRFVIEPNHIPHILMTVERFLGPNMR